MIGTFDLLQRTMRSSNHILREHLVPYGLYKGQPRMLRTISMHEGISKKDIAECHYTSMPTVTKTIERLMKNGFVKTEIDEKDRRRTLVYLTEEGQATNEELKSFKSNFSDLVFKDISEEELKQLEKICNKMLDNIKSYKENS